MRPFRRLTSTVIPLPFNNVDTDQIIPARFLKVTHKDGLAEGLFAGWRYLPDGNPDPAFALNRPEYRGARILLVGDNFGCGSSREHAPWALLGFGIQAIISTSFADIFRNNAFKNGLLPLVLDHENHLILFDIVKARPDSRLEIDLASQTLTLPNTFSASFPIDAFSKTCMVEGIDQLGFLLKRLGQIEAYEQSLEY